MVRTKDSAGVKVVGAKATRKVTVTSNAGSSSSGGDKGEKKDKFSGGNPYCPRETPSWQKEITTFFTLEPKQDDGAGSSKNGADQEQSSSSKSKSSVTSEKEDSASV